MNKPSILRTCNETLRNKPETNIPAMFCIARFVSAAALCKKHNTTPRGIYTNHIKELRTLMEQDLHK